jgi:hypothetical protein
LRESGFNPHTSSHGLSGAELTRLPLNAPTSNQKKWPESHMYTFGHFSGNECPAPA